MAEPSAKQDGAAGADGVEYDYADSGVAKVDADKKTEETKGTSPGDDDDQTDVPEAVQRHLTLTVDAESERVLKEGFMQKQGGYIQNWKKRYFVLTESALAYYSDTQKKSADLKGGLLIEQVRLVKEAEPYDTKGKKHVITVETGERRYLFQCKDLDDMNDWLEKISTAWKNVTQKGDKKEEKPASSNADKPEGRPKASHPKVSVLVVFLEFTSTEQKDLFKKVWGDLAVEVYAAEPNCLSYEFCDSIEDDKKGVIYERYVSRADLDGKHQETLKAFNMDSKLPAGAMEGVKKSLASYQETNIGHMDR